MKVQVAKKIGLFFLPRRLVGQKASNRPPAIPDTRVESQKGKSKEVYQEPYKKELKRRALWIEQQFNTTEYLKKGTRVVLDSVRRASLKVKEAEDANKSNLDKYYRTLDTAVYRAMKYVESKDVESKRKLLLQYARDKVKDAFDQWCMNLKSDPNPRSHDKWDRQMDKLEKTVANYLNHWRKMLTPEQAKILGNLPYSVDMGMFYADEFGFHYNYNIRVSFKAETRQVAAINVPHDELENFKKKHLKIDR